LELWLKEFGDGPGMNKRVVIEPAPLAGDEEKIAAKSPQMLRPDGVWSRPVLVCLLILTILVVIGALYIGKEVILPIVLALVLKLLLQPIVDVLCEKLRIPDAVSAFILILALFGSIAVVGFTISGPASGWIRKAPEVLPSLKQKLVVLRQPIDYMQQAFKELENVATHGGPDANAPTVNVKDQSAIAGAVTRVGLASLGRFFSTMVVLFFLLAAGDRLLRGLIEILPRLSDKRQALDIAFEIQRNIGGYLLTITLMNSFVGIATGLAMWSCGLGDPILWGAMAFLLNYVPILGPLTGIGIFLVAGIVALDWPWYAVLPAFFYTLIHITEGELITPMLLAKRFTLNPVIVIVSLFFWEALWGIPGAFLAVPLLAVIKIICDRIETLRPMGHIIGA
jgi:predicted PurR-regulated permease PerM